ncbi:MAG: hypothetical protein ACXVAU_15185, partial [Mucilaginibacter sp.]
FVNMVYIGRGGADMHMAITVLFKALKQGVDNEPEIFKKLKLNFIGTSYAPNGLGKPTILPLAKQFGVEDNVIEITDRISYYHTLVTLQQADALFIPGSDDPGYTASKIYPYLLTQRPLLALFHSESVAVKILREYGVKDVYDHDSKNSYKKVYDFLKHILNRRIDSVEYQPETIKKYSAENMAMRQCLLFDAVLNGKN